MLRAAVTSSACGRRHGRCRWPSRSSGRSGRPASSQAAGPYAIVGDLLVRVDPLEHRAVHGFLRDGRRLEGVPHPEERHPHQAGDALLLGGAEHGRRRTVEDPVGIEGPAPAESGDDGVLPERGAATSHCAVASPATTVIRPSASARASGLRARAVIVSPERSARSTRWRPVGPVAPRTSSFMAWPALRACFRPGSSSKEARRSRRPTADGCPDGPSAASGSACRSATSFTNTAATSATTAATAATAPKRKAECVPEETTCWYASRACSGSSARLAASSRADCSVTLPPSAPALSAMTS